MPAKVLLAVIRVVLAVLGLVLVNAASAHPGHHAGAANTAAGAVNTAAAAAVSPHVLVADAVQVRSTPGCPGHGGGECCCDEVVAHAPPQSQPQAVAPACASTHISPARSRIVVRASRAPVSHAIPIVIGSRGSRGPPSLLQASHLSPAA